jgi:cyclic-di-AMP phosphodiesterase PgpH
MPKFHRIWKPSRKYLTNLFFFLLSIAIITLILPRKYDFSMNVLAGRLILVSFCYLILYLFLLHFYSEILDIIRKTLFIILTILSFVILTRFVTDFQSYKLIYLVPFAIIPVVIRTFYDARLALFVLLITLMLAGLIVPNPYELIFMNFVTGMVVIYTLTNIYRRAKFFFTGLMVLISYSVLYAAISLVHDGSLENVIWTDFVLFSANGIQILVSYPLIFIFEKRFLFLSDNTLLELADTNQPVLRKLSKEAPGSFQHSLQVSNLAEEAARTVGANPLLVRAGALYHDIGKIANPKFFIENLVDEVSPHDSLKPLDSAKSIINHVKNGVVLAKNFKVPVQIIDFIRMHHGTTKAYFFLKKYTDMYPDDDSLNEEFTYPGPKPFSKETAIVMMADAVEAASRSLKNFTEETISEMVERIVCIQEQDGQFSEVPLTFKDLSDIKSVFKKRLSNIYHIRIAYPERD